MANEPIEAFKHIQRAWDTLVTMAAYNELLARCSLPVDQTRLKALTTWHAGDWLHTLPLTAVGLRLSDEAIRVATCFHLGMIILLTAHMNLWGNGRRQGSTQSGVSIECATSHTSLPAQ